jgi:hypothetical protein
MTDAVIQAEFRALRKDLERLEEEKASKESVSNLGFRMDRLDTRLNNLNQALLIGAISWLVGSGMFLIAVLQLKA